MTQPEQTERLEDTPESQNDLETISLPEAALAYLNAIEDAISVLTSHIKNKELAEAEETLSLITTETTELRTLLLEQTTREEI